MSWPPWWLASRAFGTPEVGVEPAHCARQSVPRTTWYGYLSQGDRFPSVAPYGTVSTISEPLREVRGTVGA